MLELVGVILTAILASAMILYLYPPLASKLAAYLKAIFLAWTAKPGRNKPAAAEPVEPPRPPDLHVLNCRVRLTAEYNLDSSIDVFVIEICGTIHAPDSQHCTDAQIKITDGAAAVRAGAKQAQIKDSPTFCYTAELGRLPNAHTLLPDWTAVAKIQTDRIILPRKGERNLHFDVAILSRQTACVLASAECSLFYESGAPGYLDLEENIQRTKTLAVAVAFAVSSADKKIYDCEVALIKSWARQNVDTSAASDRAKASLEKALDKTLEFFTDGNQIDVEKICNEIAAIAPLAQRCDIIDLCMNVARADGAVAPEELALLNNMAAWLRLDDELFRNMMAKILPVTLHQVKDAQVVFGLNAAMTKDETRKRLNKEYSKWNARVTNTDPEIQTQADQMLKFIADARNVYVG
jgi:tellurite resistance protein